MHTPQIFVIRHLGSKFAVHPLDSELMRFYPTEAEALRHAVFMLQWLGHSGDPVMTRRDDGALHVSFTKAQEARWDLV